MKYEGHVNVAIVLGGLLLVGWCLGRAQGRTPSVQENSRVFKGVVIPDRKKNPFWKECTTLVDIPEAADGSQSAVCTNLKGQKYDLILRPISKVCTAVTPKETDGYQHFICSEQDELMFKAQAREGDADPKRNLGAPVGEL